MSNKNFLQNLTLKIPLINFEIPIEFWFLLLVGIIFWIFRVWLINKIFGLFRFNYKKMKQRVCIFLMKKLKNLNCFHNKFPSFPPTKKPFFYQKISSF